MRPWSWFALLNYYMKGADVLSQQHRKGRTSILTWTGMAIRNLLTGIVSGILILPIFSGEPVPDRQPYRPGDVEIEWKVPTHALRGQFWIYKSVPQSFSGAVISNAVVIGSFEARHLVNPHDKKAFQFQDAQRSPTRQLRVEAAAGTLPRVALPPSLAEPLLRFQSLIAFFDSACLGGIEAPQFRHRTPYNTGLRPIHNR
jgi:hypothetical protein